MIKTSGESVRPVYLVESSADNKVFTFQDIFQSKADAVQYADNHSAPFVIVRKTMKPASWHIEQFGSVGNPVDVEFNSDDIFEVVFIKGGN